MKVQINSYIKRDAYGSFLHGQVFFESLVKNNEAESIPSYLIVNLSKSGNPQCDTSIFHLQGHNGHAGTFTSKSMMRMYIERVKQDMTNLIQEYNIQIEDVQSSEPKLDYPITHDNDELHPSGMELPAGMVVVDWQTMAEMMGYEVLDEEDLFEGEQE